jgi:hypothetical protein
VYMDSDKIKIELFRFIDALPVVRLNDLYEMLLSQKDDVEVIGNKLSDWQQRDINAGIKDLDEGRKMDFDQFIATL